MFSVEKKLHFYLVTFVLEDKFFSRLLSVINLFYTKKFLGTIILPRLVFTKKVKLAVAICAPLAPTCNIIWVGRRSHVPKGGSLTNPAYS